MSKQKQQLENFAKMKKSVNDMVAASESAYTNSSSNQRAKTYQAYTKEQVQSAIDRGDPNELRDLSISFLYTSGFYRRMIYYLATLPTYDTLLIPDFEDKKQLSPQVKNKFEEALKYLKSFDVKNQFTKFALKVFIEGAYYGMISPGPNNKDVIMELPYEYCQSRFMTHDGIDIVEFDLKYFDAIYNKELRDACLKTYPKEIRSAYNTFKNKNGERWYIVPPEFGVHFNLGEERPFLTDIIPAIMDFNDYREIEKKKDLLDIEKILAQEMPHTNDGEMMFDPEEVAVMHKGLCDTIGKQRGIDVVTSFGKVAVHDMQSHQGISANNLEKISDSIYTEAGVSKQLFAANNNTSLNRSIENDTSLVFFLANRFRKWLEVKINNKFKSGKLSFSLNLLPITIYNRQDYFKTSFQAAQFGFSFLLPAIALGVPQTDLTNLKKLENEYMNLDEFLLPLQSANTQSGDEQGKEKVINDGVTSKKPGKEDNKGNTKLDTEKADQTMKNINSGGQE